MFVDESFSLPDLAQDLFETMPLGVVYQEANGKIVAANPAALHILGLTLDQVLGRTSLDPRWRAIHEDGSDFPGDEHPSMQALHSGQVVRDVIMGIYNPQIKAYHWINITAIPLFKNANELPYMALTTFENITARVKAEAALSESEGLWKFAVEGFGDGLWDWSPQSGQVYYSPQWKAMLGYASDEIGSSADEWSTRIHPDDRERILAGTANLLSRKIPVYTDEYRLRCRDGSYKWIFDRAQVIRWAADGKPLRVLGTHSDITARREMENRLRENEERYRALYEYSPISIWEEDFSALATEIRRLQGEGVTDLRAYLEQYPQTVREMASLIRIIDINQATVDFFERNNKAELNRDLTSYFTEESLLAFRKEIVAIAEGKTSFQYEIPIRGANDRRRLLLLSLVVTPGYETTYERVLVSFIDITEQRQAEQEIRQHNRELEINREILTSLAGHFTLEAILARIVKGALELTGLEGSLLYICDEQQQLRLAACQNIPGDLQEAIQRGPLHLADDPGGSIKEALFWPAIEAKPPSSAADCGVEHNNNPAIQAAGIQFYAALPLSMKGRLISLLCIFTRQDQRPSRRSLGLLQDLCGPFALAIENAQLYENARRDAARAEALARIAARLITSLDLQTVVNTVCEEAALALNVPAANLLLRDEETDLMHVAACYGLPPDYREQYRPFPGEDYRQAAGQIGPVLYLRDVYEYPQMTNFALFRQHNIRSILSGRLAKEDRLLGILNVITFHKVRLFSKDDMLLLQGLADQAAQAIENARLFTQVSAGRRHLQMLSQKLVEVQEAERRSLALELHDELGQMLNSAKMSLDMAPQLPPEAASEHLLRAQALVSDLVARVRRISLDLRPSMLDDMGLLPALHWLFKNFYTQTGENVVFEYSNIERRFPIQVELTAYRITQEALTNVIRHAGKTQVEIEIWADAQAINLQITDHGQGFDPRAVLQGHESSGLHGMRERTRLLGGELVVESEPGAGVTLSAWLPFLANELRT